MRKHRQLIFDIIVSSNGHMTADEIYFEAKKIKPSIAVGTVYRNLGIMTQSGEIRKISMPNSPDRYDKTLSPHEHLVCQQCGMVSDICIPCLKDYIEQQTGTTISGYDLNLKHLCDKCKSNN